MELIRSDDFYILQHVQKGESNLWISRHTGQWEVRPSWDLAGQENLECLGLVWALYGKLSIHPDLPERLVLVKHCDRVAELPAGPYSPNSLQGKNSKNQYSFNASQKRSQMLPKIDWKIIFMQKRVTYMVWLLWHMCSRNAYNKPNHAKLSTSRRS